MTDMKDTLIRIVVSLFFFVTCAVFWAVFCPGYMCHQEWFQLFQFTPEYFRDLVLTPGGFAAWCGRFLMQFYCIPWAGGIVIAAVLCGIQMLCFCMACRRNALSFSLSLIPAASFFFLLCANEGFLTPAVSCLLCLIAARCLVSASKYIQTAVTPFVWFLFGPFSLIYIAVCVCSDSRLRIVPALIQLVIWFACPAVWSLFDLYQFKNLLIGIYSTRHVWITPVLAWIACGISIVSLAVISRKLPGNVFASAAVYAACAGLAVWGVSEFISFRYEKLMEYDCLVNNGDWEAIIRKSNHDPVTSEDVHLETNDGEDRWNINDIYTLKYSLTALAYAQRGQLVDKMFARFCPGPEGLFPEYDKSVYAKNVLISDIFYHIAMISQSQELMFESMETIPDKQKGTRAYIRLALTNSINGNYAVSDKYLHALSHTLFHSDFAKKFNHSSPELEQFRRFRYYGRQYPYNYDALLSELDDLVKQCPDNKIASQYLVALVMLQKDLKYLHYVASMVYPDASVPYPDPLQQALTVWLVSRENFDGKIPPYISQENVKKGMAFMDEFEKLGSMSGKKRRSAVNALRKKYGNTYYFFYYLQ